MSNVEYRSAQEQCQEYIERAQARARRTAAERSFDVHIQRMSANFGASVTVLVMVRWVGIMLVEGGTRAVVQTSRGYLVRCILRSIARQLLTRVGLLH